MTTRRSVSRYRRGNADETMRSMNAPSADRLLFERLCELRALYAQRGRKDRDGVISVERAIRYGEELLARSAASTV
jgi:hypothetical protein